MRNFNNDNNSSRPYSGGRSSDRRDSGRSNFSGRDSGRNQMHDAVCSDCGNNCKVPFVPSSGKPIYCSDCFEKRGNGSGDSGRPNYSTNRRGDDRGSRRPSFSDRGNSSASSRPAKDYDRQFEIVNDKLDKLLQALAPEEEKTSKAKAKAPKKAAVQKPAPKKEVVVEEPVMAPEVAKVMEVAPQIEIVEEPVAETVPELVVPEPNVETVAEVTPTVVAEEPAA